MNVGITIFISVYQFKNSYAPLNSNNGYLDKAPVIGLHIGFVPDINPDDKCAVIICPSGQILNLTQN